jgi:hypothetical protein
MTESWMYIILCGFTLFAFFLMFLVILSYERSKKVVDNRPIKLFLDCDGVLADFDKKAIEMLGVTPREYERKNGPSHFWRDLYQIPDFFFVLEPMPDAYDLVNAVKHLNPTILTGLPRHEEEATDQKQRWRAKYFPELPMITVKSALKFEHMHPECRNILVDDWNRYKHVWEDNGGEFVLHTSAADSIKQLKEMGVL